MSDKCANQCNNCNLNCIAKTAKCIVVGDIKIVLAEDDEKT
jgi:hypothetical protein